MSKQRLFSQVVYSVLLGVLLIGMLSAAVVQPGVSGGRMGEVVFTIPAGPEGVQYEGGDAPETLRWGPAAFTVAPDGSFWVADTVGNRLLHYSPQGDLLGRIGLEPYQVVGVGDLEATASDVFVLDVAATTPRMLRLALDGSLLAGYELPENLSLAGGLSGIALGDQGEVWIEREGGALVSQLVDTKGRVTGVELAGYLRGGRLYSARPADLTAGDSRQGTVIAGSVRIQVKVSNVLAGLRFLGVSPDGSFYVITEEMVSYPAIQVDQVVRHYGASGKLLGLARVALAEQYTHVAQNLAIGPDGAVYALITRPDHLEVQRLGFSAKLRPILPSMPVWRIPPKEADGSQVPQACRQRSAMINTAVGYVNNSKYLSATNTDGPCPGREKPRYIAGAGTYPSVAYDWGGWDTVSGYNGSMHPNTLQAGDIPRTAKTVEQCSRGTDCSGFVSRCWSLPYKHSTRMLPNISCQLKSTSCLIQGDIMNNYDEHVVLFRSFARNGFNGYESTTLNGSDRVVSLYHTWSSMSGYVPRRYCNVCSPTCADTCAVSPSPCP